MLRFISIAIIECNTLLNMATPSSVKANGRYFMLLPRPEFPGGAGADDVGGFVGAGVFFAGGGELIHIIIHMAGRHMHIPGHYRVVGNAVVLPVRHHHQIDEDARHHDVARTLEGMAHPVHLRDDDAAVRLGRLRRGEGVDGDVFLFKADVAVRIEGGAADEDDVELRGFVIEEVPAVHLDVRDQLLCGQGVHSRAADSGVDEEVQADFAEQAVLSRRRRADGVGEDALRKIVCFDAVFHPLRCQLSSQPFVMALTK